MKNNISFHCDDNYRSKIYRSIHTHLSCYHMAIQFFFYPNRGLAVQRVGQPDYCSTFTFCVICVKYIGAALCCHLTMSQTYIILLNMLKHLQWKEQVFDTHNLPFIASSIPPSSCQLTDAQTEECGIVDGGQAPHSQITGWSEREGARGRGREINYN